VAIGLTLLLEGLLVYLLLTLSTSIVHRPDDVLAVFDVAGPKSETPAEDKAEPEQKPEAKKPQPARQPPTPQPPQPQPDTPQPASPIPPAIIPMSRDQMASANIGALPRAPAAPAPRAFGPVDSGGAPGDSAMVGNAPNGEPMYAASWYREPSSDELRGYLSTAQPGWGLIACRTVAEYRVEDCVGLDEYPNSSGLNRAILAAAWQFRVRPPRVGGKVKVGEWVRIRIDYNMRRKLEARP
jgi:protein TonB